MGIIDGKLLDCHGVAEGNVDREFSTLEYNNRTVYDCFNNPFTYEFGSPSFNIPPIIFDDRPCPHKIACYTQICSQLPSLLPLKIILVL